MMRNTPTVMLQLCVTWFKDRLRRAAIRHLFDGQDVSRELDVVRSDLEALRVQVEAIVALAEEDRAAVRTSLETIGSALSFHQNAIQQIVYERYAAMATAECSFDLPRVPLDLSGTKPN